MTMKKYIQIALLLYVSFGYSQEFGQNKVQYEAFDWNYIRSPHFDVYYYKQNSRNCDLRTVMSTNDDDDGL